MRSNVLAFVPAIAVFAAACAAESSSPSPASGTRTTEGAPTSPADATSGGSNASRGPTACGSFPDGVAKTCQAGQYCADERYSECSNGCLSDDNCASNQTCVKDKGKSDGDCLNATPADEGPSCEALCDKALGCGVATDTKSCLAACKGLTAACKSCVLEKPCNAPEDSCNVECGL